MWIDRRWRTALVSVSLLLNVFLVGIVAGHFWAAQPQAAFKRPDLPLIPQVNLRTLPPEQRKLFRSTIGSHRDAIRAARQEQHSIKLMTEADIAAETFDRTKVAADLAALRQANMAVQAAANVALLDALGKLPPGARATLVNGEFRDAPPAP